MNHNRYFIKIHNDAHRDAVQRRLLDMGGEWPVGGKQFQTNADGDLCVILDGGHWSIRHSADKSYGNPKIVTLDDLYEMESFGPKSAKVKLNENHAAIVTKDSIKVGCQTFPVSIIQDLADALVKVTQ